MMSAQPQEDLTAIWETTMNDTATLSRLFSAIQQDLDVVEQTFQERASSGLDLLNVASAHAFSSPGKRLRTALTLLSGKLGDYLFEKLLLVSVAFEVVHLATLVHDDIIDHADTRRGIPTVNARWGEGVAILLGDYLLSQIMTAEAFGRAVRSHWGSENRVRLRARCGVS
jgi:heptaprenyl diphosphate synthase